VQANALKTKRTVPTTETVLEKQMKIEAGSEALQQIAQSQEGLVDHVDIVDDGACTGEDAGNGVEHLTLPLFKSFHTLYQFYQ